MEGSSPARSEPPEPSQGRPATGNNGNSAGEVVLRHPKQEVQDLEYVTVDEDEVVVIEREVTVDAVETAANTEEVAAKVKKVGTQAEEVAAKECPMKALDQAEKMVDAIRDAVQDVMTSFNYAEIIDPYEKKIFDEFSDFVSELNLKVNEVGKEINTCQSTMKTDLSMNRIDNLVLAGFSAVTKLNGIKDNLKETDREFKEILEKARVKLDKAVRTLKQSRKEIDTALNGLIFDGRDKREAVLISAHCIKTEPVEKMAQNTTPPNPQPVIEPASPDEEPQNLQVIHPAAQYSSPIPEIRDPETQKKDSIQNQNGPKENGSGTKESASNETGNKTKETGLIKEKKKDNSIEEGGNQVGKNGGDPDNTSEETPAQIPTDSHNASPDEEPQNLQQIHPAAQYSFPIPENRDPETQKKDSIQNQNGPKENGSGTKESASNETGNKTEETGLMKEKKKDNSIEAGSNQVGKNGGDPDNTSGETPAQIPTDSHNEETRKRRGSLIEVCASKRHNTEASVVYDSSAIHTPGLVQGDGDDEVTQVRKIPSDLMDQVKEKESHIEEMNVDDNLAEQHAIIDEDEQIKHQERFYHEDMDFGDSFERPNLSRTNEDDETDASPAVMEDSETTAVQPNLPSTSGPLPKKMKVDQPQVFDKDVSMEKKRENGTGNGSTDGDENVSRAALTTESANYREMEKYATNRMTRSANNTKTLDSVKADTHDIPSANCRVPEKKIASRKEDQQQDSNKAYESSWLLKKQFVSAYKEKTDDAKRNLPKQPQELLEKWKNEDKEEKWSEIMHISNDETPDAEPDYISSQKTIVEAVDTVQTPRKLPVPPEMARKRNYPLMQYDGENNIPPTLYLARLNENSQNIRGEEVVKLGKQSAEENKRRADEKLHLDHKGKVLPPINKVCDSSNLRRAALGKSYKTSFCREKGVAFKGKAEKGTPQPVVAVRWDHPNLKEIITRQSISLIDGCLEAVDANAFTLDEIKLLKQDNKYNKIEAIRERAQSHNENQLFKDSDETIRGIFDKENIELAEYIEHHKKLVSECRGGLDQFFSKDHVDFAFLKKFDEKLRQMQRPYKGSRNRSFPVITFGSNIDVINGKKQEEAIKRLNAYMRPNGELMKKVNELIFGVNTIQIYLKGPGCRTYAHWENSALASININLGPDDCIWFGVSMKYAADVEFLLCQNGIKQDATPVWPLEKVLEDNGIPYYKFVQKPGQAVHVGVGTYHWVQSTGNCTNISWNVLEDSEAQVAALAFFHDFFVELNNKTLLPVEHIFWKCAEEQKGAGESFGKLVKKFLIRSLGRCSWEMDMAESLGFTLGNNKELPKSTNNHQEDCQIFRCSTEDCTQDVMFNIVYSVGPEFKAQCYNCVRQEKNVNYYVLKSIEQLTQIFDNY